MRPDAVPASRTLESEEDGCPCPVGDSLTGQAIISAIETHVQAEQATDEADDDPAGPLAPAD
jgi:hypothetical protein